MISKRHLPWAVGVVGLLMVGFVIWRYAKPDRTTIRYTTAKVDKGDIRSHVTAIGTVNPVILVEVGSQLSGIIKALHVGLNAEVRQGDPLAEIDPSPFQAQLKQAKANLKKALEDVRTSRTLMRENADLYHRALMSEEEYNASQSKYAVAQASYEQLQAALEIAQSRLDATTIRSPIDGVVVSKHVEVGQMVSANSQTPALFLIADNLRKMQLDTNVSEADIGKIAVGQTASFSVDAYPAQTFEGQVWQIHNMPTTVQNVVMYDVVLRIENADLKLKPGMTAEVSILVASRQHVLRVPRAALRFIPPAGARIHNPAKARNDATVVWTLLPDEQLQGVVIQPGISDEQFTEVLSSTLREGDEVVVEAALEGSSGVQPLGSVLPQPERF